VLNDESNPSGVAQPNIGNPLAGVRVIDLGQIYAAPYATLLMALNGAEIIKIEPLTGEPLRKRNTVKNSGAELPFYLMNAGKQGITLNLKSPRGRELLGDLLVGADILVENFRPGVMDRLGLGATHLRERFPQLIYASCSGYGQSGAYRDLPAMDLTIQAMSGVMAATGFIENGPVKTGPAVADFFGGIHLYGAIVTALYRRAVTGDGATVDVAMLEAVYPSLMSNLGLLLGSATPPPERTGNRHGGLAQAPYNVYPTANGHIALITVSEQHWSAVARLIGQPELVDDDRYCSNTARVAHIEEVDKIISEWTSELTTADVFTTLRDAGVPCAPVRTLRDVVDEPHLRERELIFDREVPGVGTLPFLHSPLRFEGEPRTPPGDAPELGGSNDEVYSELLGLSAADVAELRAQGVI
jgi:formyl-CoA transferase